MGQTGAELIESRAHIIQLEEEISKIEEMREKHNLQVNRKVAALRERLQTWKKIGQRLFATVQRQV